MSYMIIYLGFRPGLWYMRGKLRDSWVGKEGNQDLGFRSSLLAWQVKDQEFPCCGWVQSFYVGLTQSLETSACHGHNKKKKKKKKYSILDKVSLQSLRDMQVEVMCRQLDL